MIQIEFAEAEVQQLHYERYHHPHPRVQMKMEALYLKAKGLPHGLIADYVGVCENTLRTYLREYQTGGIAGVKQVNFHRPTSALEPHRPTLEDYFADHPSATIAEAAEAIERLTGIRRQPTQVRVFLRKLGLKRRKTAAIPAKYDEAQQEECKKKSSNRGSPRR